MRFDVLLEDRVVARLEVDPLTRNVLWYEEGESRIHLNKFAVCSGDLGRLSSTFNNRLLDPERYPSKEWSNLLAEYRHTYLFCPGDLNWLKLEHENVSYQEALDVYRQCSV